LLDNSIQNSNFLNNSQNISHTSSHTIFSPSLNITDNGQKIQSASNSIASIHISDSETRINSIDSSINHFNSTPTSYGLYSI
jgi:hypothetical protein